MKSGGASMYGDRDEPSPTHDIVEIRVHVPHSRETKQKSKEFWQNHQQSSHQDFGG
jgi:hypothetical protein